MTEGEVVVTAVRTIESQAARIAELEAALQALLDEQNGPPLLRDRLHWEAAVKRAQALLRKE